MIQLIALRLPLSLERRLRMDSRAIHPLPQLSPMLHFVLSLHPILASDPQCLPRSSFWLLLF